MGKVRARRVLAGVVVLVLAVAGLPAGASSGSSAGPRPSFADPSYYRVGADAVVVADFTGDGRRDVAAASPAVSSSPTVALLVQTRTGSLAEPQQIIAHTGELATVSAVAADINGDRLTDLLVGSSNGIDIFEQRAGGLNPPRLIPGLQAYQIVVADINLDGIPDLVVGTYFTGGLRTMVGRGGGQFGPPVTVSTDSWPYRQFQIGDVTGDGIPDIVGHYVTTVEVRSGRRDGTFRPPVQYVIPWKNNGGEGLALGDFNGDGRHDVAVTNSSNNPGSAVHVFYQTPAGTFGPATTLPSLDVTDMIEGVDVNGDGRLDLVVAHGGWDYAGVYLQQPDGTFTVEQLHYTGRQYFNASSGLDVGDINHDRLPDIVVGSAGGLVVLRQTGALPERSGYWMLGSTGSVYAFGDAAHRGAPTGTAAANIAQTRSGNGYWIVSQTGAVHAYGDAVSFGRPPILRAGEKVSSLSPTPTGSGYWLFTNQGRALPYGGAPFFGDVGHVRLNGPVLGSVATPSGNGYYMVASDGGIFAFGDAAFAGSMGGQRLDGPVVGLAPDPDGSGYWLVASDGGIFAFSARFRGSMGRIPLNGRMVGMVAYGDGYLMVASDGGIFNFSSEPFRGSLGNNPPPNPIIAVAPLTS